MTAMKRWIIKTSGGAGGWRPQAGEGLDDAAGKSTDMWQNATLAERQREDVIGAGAAGGGAWIAEVSRGQSLGRTY